MTQYEETITDFITGTHLIQFKGYYEMDLVNVFTKIRYIFHIPKELFDMMILGKEKLKIQAKQRKIPKPREAPILTS